LEWDYVITPAAGHMSTVRNTVYYLLFQAFGMNARAYFVIVLATHVTNVLLLFVLIRRITGSDRLAAVGALLFGTSVANAGTLGWFAVYGQALGGTLMLVALLLVVPRAGDPRPLTTRAAVGASCFMFAASQCFGTAAAVALVFPLLVATIRPRAFRAWGPAIALAMGPVLVLAALVVSYWTPTRLNPAPEGKPLWIKFFARDYPDILIMMRHLVAVGSVSFLAGAAYPVTRYPDGWSLAVGVGFALALSWALIRGSSRERRLLAAFLALPLVSYGAIAAGKAGFLTFWRPTTLVYTYAMATRYQYLPQLAFAVVVALVLAVTGSRVTWSPRTRTGLVYAIGVLAVALNLLLRPPMEHFESDRRAMTAFQAQIEKEVQSGKPGSQVCVQNGTGRKPAAFRAWPVCSSFSTAATWKLAQ
jgi:hypothetical protein